MKIIHVHVGDAEVVWRESEHPRRGTGPGGGEFTASGAGRGGGTLHIHVKPDVPEPIQTLAERGGYDIASEERAGTFVPPGSRTLRLTPKMPQGWQKTAKGEVYDPAYASEDPEWGRTVLKPGVTTEFPGKAQAGSIWRGMSQEEYQDVLAKGRIKSSGGYNIGPSQEGVTLYSSDPGQAASYAHGFAPWQRAGTISQPPVVVRVKDPGGHVEMPGAGGDEIGLKGEVPLSDIQEVWQGKPIIVGPGSFDLDPNGKMGSGGAPKATVIWQKQEGGGATFASPSVTDLDLPGATKALSGARQKAFEAAARDVDRALGIQSEERPVVGAWTDGAENSTMMYAPSASLDQLRLSAAMKGLLGQQKAVLVFHNDPAGLHLIYRAHVSGEMADIHQGLLACGVVNHTLAPAGDGADVYIADLDGSAAKGLSKFAVQRGVEFEGEHGTGEFIGAEHYEGTTDAEQRAEGAAAFRQAIAGSQLAGPEGSAAEVWGRLRDRWATRIAGTQDRRVVDQEVAWIEQQHPRKGRGPGGGEFTTKGSGGATGAATAPSGPKVHVHVHAEPEAAGGAPTGPEAQRPAAQAQQGAAALQQAGGAMHVHLHQPDGTVQHWTLAKGDPTGKSSWAKIASIAKRQAITAYKLQKPRAKAEGADISKRINDFMAGAAQDESWRDWYERHRGLAKQLYGRYEPMFEQALGITSINTPFKRNVQLAVDVTNFMITGGRWEPLPKGVPSVRWPTPDGFQEMFGYRLLPQQVAKLYELQEQGTVTGLKIGPFTKALGGDPEGVPIDRHMARFLFEGYGGTGEVAKSDVSELQHAVGQAVVKAWAKELGWGPRELQAVTWVASMREQGLKLGDFKDELMAKSSAINDFLARAEGAEQLAQSISDDAEFDYDPGYLEPHTFVKGPGGSYPGVYGTGDAAPQPGFIGLANLAKSYVKTAQLLTLFETIREALPGEQLTPENVAKLMGLELPTPTKDADPWANEPRKGKGPGGGEWTSGGGGGAVTALATSKGKLQVHVHQELTPKQKAEAAHKAWEEEHGQAKRPEVDPSRPLSEQLTGGPAGSHQPERYQGVGGKEFTGPHALEDAQRTGRLLAGAENRKAVEATMKKAELKLVDPTDASPRVVKAFGLESYADGLGKAGLWYDDTPKMAQGLADAMAKIGAPSLEKEMRGNVNVMFASYDRQRPGTYGAANNPIAAVWGDKATGQQWLVVNTANTLDDDWSPGEYMNTVGAQNAKTVYDAGIAKTPPEKYKDREALHAAQALALRDAMIHEMGHILDNATGLGIRRGLAADVKRITGGDVGVDFGANEWMRQHFSDYSATNPAEGAAEAWTMAITRPEAFPAELKGWRDAALGSAKGAWDE